MIGAYRDDDDHGAVYVFERDPVDPTVWTQIAKLTGGALYFGVSVAMSGDTAVIGASGGRGSAYVFERDPLDPAVWTQTARLSAPDGGGSVAISGDTAVIGASGDSDSSGAAYVFERDPVDPAAWTQTAKLTASDGDAYDYFGRSVAMVGDTAIIGAPYDDDLGLDSGATYVFERDPLDPALWTQTAKLTARLEIDGHECDVFGESVAISGDTAVIGAYDLNAYAECCEFDMDGCESGSAYVFERDPLDPAVWTQTARLTAADKELFDAFGDSVAISGDTAVIGARRDDARSGSAYVFERDRIDPAAWTQTAKLTASDGETNDEFGESVAISGDTAVVGAPNDDDYVGAAYVYAPLRCELALAVEPMRLRAGEELRVAVDLDHRRPVTVTVPFLLWIEDAAGRVVAQKSSPPVTMEPGDHRQVRLALTLPPGLPPGTYRVLVGVNRMQQGIARGAAKFRVVD